MPKWESDKFDLLLEGQLTRYEFRGFDPWDTLDLFLEVPLRSYGFQEFAPKQRVVVFGML